MIKKVLNSMLKSKTTLSAFMFVAGILTVFSQTGCCFYIFHQPKYPEALRMVE